MPAFQDAKDKTEQKMMLGLMTQIEQNPMASQRHMASELDIALGLMNTYLKRLIKKGWVKAKAVPAKRYAYFITPEGFIEKSRIVGQYLKYSFNFFRDAQAQFENVYETCKAKDFNKVVLVGDGDLAQVGKLVAQASGMDVQVVSPQSTLKDFDAVVVTDISNPQEVYDTLIDEIEDQRLFTLGLLHISRRSQP